MDQISIYHKVYLGNEFRYIAQIATDTIDLLTKKPENFEVKFVDSKIHQSLFSELYHFLNEVLVISLTVSSKSSLIEFG